jgi:uncharacterized protein (UPF0332 family)
MTREERIQYARYRMNTAFKTYEAAKVLADHGFWNSALNRLYYAAFYALNALLTMHGLDTRSHSGVKSLFSLHFIKTGKVDKKFGRIFAELYDWRQKGDYENLFDYDENSVKPLFEPVLEMITTIDQEIKG